MDLFISDLDGTLLNTEGKLSQYTIESINNLIAMGLQFSIATARGMDSVKKILEPINIDLPIILNNGLFIYDLKKNEVIKSHCIDNKIALDIYKILLDYNINPMIRVKENNQFKVYYKSNQSSVIKDFIASKKNLKAIEFIQLSNIKFNNCKIHSIFTIGKKEKLRDANKFLNSKFNLSIDFYHDIYNDSYWLEINPLKATKGEAVFLLKERFEFDRIISFGDNLNDLSMFHRSDLSHGMSSGNLKIRSHVSKIIGTNDEDSVVKEINCIYLEKNSQYKEIS